MIDWLGLPPLTALRAFAALAETGSVVAAGQKLNVSHAAISQQIKTLEAHMGLALVDRSGRALALTPQGQQLATDLADGFGKIASTVNVLTGADANRPLHISTTPMFAAAWLMPQLGEFNAAHPGIDLILSTTPKLHPLEPGGIDLALRYGDGNWPQVQSETLVRSPMAIVAAPTLVGNKTFDTMDELGIFPWLEDVGTSEANNWLRHSSQITGRRGTRTQLPGNLLLDGARDGQGVAVVVKAFVEKDILAGRLRLLFENDDAKGYHIVTRPGVQRPVLKTFLSWLRKCAKG